MASTGATGHALWGPCDWCDECLGWWRGDPYVFPAGFAKQEHVFYCAHPEYPKPVQDRVGFFLLDAVRLWFRVLRARAVEGVLLLREPVGEDVRVATSPP